MARAKVTVSLSSRCLETIDLLAESTGLESRSRVIEELTFSVVELMGYRKIYHERMKKASDPQKKFFELSSLLSKMSGILDRFTRFANVPHLPTRVNTRLTSPKDTSQGERSP